MTWRRKIIAFVALAIISVAGYVVYQVVYTVRHIPEAYAAWDTGTLLIEYMKFHDGRWPSSWEDLLTVMEGNSGANIPLRGAEAGNVKYAQSLRDMVAVDWTFDPNRRRERPPVTRPDGTVFPIVWAGAEPNEMIYAYLATKKTSGKSQNR